MNIKKRPERPHSTVIAREMWGMGAAYLEIGMALGLSRERCRQLIAGNRMEPWLPYYEAKRITVPALRAVP